MIIGITGKAGSGKTTFARLLSTQLDPCILLAYADPFKKMLIKANLITYNEAYVAKTPKSRWGLQVVGDDMRAIDKDIWVKALDRELRLVPSGVNIIIHDVRRINETNYITNKNGIIIKIERPGLNSNDPHPSETEMDQIAPHYTYHNYETLSDMEKRVIPIAECIKSYFTQDNTNSVSEI